MKKRSGRAYWQERCLAQERALDSCLVATVGPRRGDPSCIAGEVELTRGRCVECMESAMRVYGLAVEWNGPETLRLIDRALEARGLR